MHIEALDFCYRAAQRTGAIANGIEFGSRDVNGSARGCWPDAEWVGLDLEPGDGVDIVADACAMAPLKFARFDLALSTEMLEHCRDPKMALQRMSECASWVLVTCATTGRAPHSAIDGGDVRDGEHYRNVAPDELDHPLLEQVMLEVHRDRGDVYMLGKVRNG